MNLFQKIATFILRVYAVYLLFCAATDLLRTLFNIVLTFSLSPISLGSFEAFIEYAVLGWVIFTLSGRVGNLMGAGLG